MDPLPDLGGGEFQRQVHPVGGAAGVAPRQLLKPKVVSADRILDLPGRSDRPSHVSSA